MAYWYQPEAQANSDMPFHPAYSKKCIFTEG